MSLPDPRSLARLSRPAAVLLDMDGTITKPRLDYAAIRADLDVPDEEPIWEAIQSRDAEGKRRALERLYVHESRAAEEAELAEGAAEVIEWLAAEGIGVAVITRNSRASAATVFAKHALPELPIFTREDAPPKPDPTVVHRACAALGTTADRAWMVGDGQFDVGVAHNAGATCIWIALERGDCPHAPAPHACIDGISELRNLIGACDTDAGGE